MLVVSPPILNPDSFLPTVVGWAPVALVAFSLLLVAPTAGATALIDGFATDLPNNEDAILLRNTDTEPIALGNATLQDGTGELRLPSQVRLEPDASLWVTTNWTSFIEAFGHEPDLAPDAPDPSMRLTRNARTFALSNSGDSISLRQEGALLDAVAYGENERDVEGWNGAPMDVGGSMSLRWFPRISTVDTDSSADWVQPRRAYVGEDLFMPALIDAHGTFIPYLAPDHSRAMLRTTLLSAQDSIRLNVYQFRDLALAQDLANHLRSTPGLRVEVILDAAPVGESKEELSERGHVIETLVDAGAVVHMLSHSRYAYDHAKYVVLDDEILLVQTENFVPGGIPADGKDGNRGWGLVIANRTVAQTAAAVFDADFEVRPFGARVAGEAERPAFPPPALGSASGSAASGVAVSASVPVTFLATPFRYAGSADPIAEAINLAETSIDVVQLDLAPMWRTINGSYVPHPYLHELVKAAERGVHVRLLLDGHFFDDSASGDNADTVDLIETRHAGLPIEARLRKGSSVLHAKGMVVDDRWVLVGSMNWNSNSVLQNREVGVLVDHAGVAGFFSEAFELDWVDAGPRRTPSLDVVTVLTLAGLALVFKGPRRR